MAVVNVVPGLVAGSGVCAGKTTVLSVEFSIYGDLNNERTEIDSELAFGF